MDSRKEGLFSEAPVAKAVLALAVPTVISQLVNVIYNMADTFFIGQLNDPLQVAAATIAMPIFVFLTAFANLFGIGGSSLISRCLGKGDRILIIGPSTGVVEMTVPEIRVDLKEAPRADKGTYCSVPVEASLLESCGGKLRRSDKVYIWKNTETE